MNKYAFLSIFIGIIYTIIGVFIILKKSFFIELKPEYGYILGGVFIVYGIFRACRAFIAIKNK